ncbi:uncharacterized protein F5147DRAFT_698539 [Suillus discolor]|uniref:Uncharacterized protein n=1 Tax=Suillus discolor TaxID=1912936 RepID=A0A9P7F656_9AGAM|nr:uncharacterized protein F5147DRAFT_698539 [Suillus discolor]KAG2107293.1 hypothetical protein F5147DRAFT_698539 [Suillus discolor]
MILLASSSLMTEAILPCSDDTDLVIYRVQPAVAATPMITSVSCAVLPLPNYINTSAYCKPAPKDRLLSKSLASPSRYSSHWIGIRACVYQLPATIDNFVVLVYKPPCCTYSVVSHEPLNCDRMDYGNHGSDYQCCCRSVPFNQHLATVVHTPWIYRTYHHTNRLIYTDIWFRIWTLKCSHWSHNPRSGQLPCRSQRKRHERSCCKSIYFPPALATLDHNLQVFAQIMGFSTCFSVSMVEFFLGIGIAGSYAILQTGGELCILYG